MDFAAILLFLVLYYIRPHEWIGALGSLRLAAFSLVLGILGTIARDRGFSWRDLLRTPHDSLLVIYLSWVILSSSSRFEMFGRIYPFAIYYFVAVQALSYRDRIQSFLNWWTVMIILVAGLAVASEYGFDPMDSYARTHYVMKGRLALGTRIFNNPNALGHSVVPCLVMIYFILYWKRPVFMKVATVAILAVPCYCIYLTQSKGSYLSGFAAVVAMLAFKRPKYVQMLILVTALSAGWTALQFLPRMGELENAQKEEGIQGRMAAFKFGLHSMVTKTSGLGYGNFGPAFAKTYDVVKSSHSSYVQVGSELGRPGLFLFVGLLYCCFRTLVSCNTNNTAEERIRRILFVLALTYVVSSWMVDCAFRATFFLMVAAIAAFHRQLTGPGNLELSAPAPSRSVPDVNAPAQPELNATQRTTARRWRGEEQLPLASPGPATVLQPVTIDISSSEEQWKPGLTWNKLSWVDWTAILVLTCAVELFWRYILRNL